MKLDDALLLLGAYGRYQVMVYLAVSFFDNFPSIWHMSVAAFIGYEPEHHCKVPAGADINCTLTNFYNNSDSPEGKCKMHLHDNLTDTCIGESVSCTEGWSYSKYPIETSIVTDWDLVCHRNVYPETTTMVFNFGVMFGAMVFGFLSDKYGRKKCFIGALLGQAVVGAATALSPNLYVFAVLRFFVGALEQGVNITGFIFATELFPPKQREVMAVNHEFLWAIGGAFLPIFGYFLRQWRHLQLMVSLPSLLAIGLWWTIPESPVWLVAKGRVQEAEEFLQKAAKMNGKSLPPNCLSEHEIKPMLNDASPTSETKEHIVDDRTYTLIDIFRTPNIRKISICISLLWALNTMVYYGLSYNTPNLDGDMYVNFFIGQMVEIPSVAFTLLVIYKVGRRWPLCLFHWFGGIVCIASPFIPKITSSGFDMKWLSVTLAMLGKFAINGSFTIIYIYGPEIYPTVVRNIGSGFGSFSGRFGGILYPYINYLIKLDHPMAKQLPMLVFGILSVIGGVLALPLPETRHNPLPETIDDIEHYSDFCKRAASHVNGHAYEMTALQDDMEEEKKSDELA